MLLRARLHALCYVDEHLRAQKIKNVTIVDSRVDVLDQVSLSSKCSSPSSCHLCLCDEHSALAQGASERGVCLPLIRCNHGAEPGICPPPCLIANWLMCCCAALGAAQSTSSIQSQYSHSHSAHPNGSASNWRPRKAHVFCGLGWQWRC